MAPVYGQRLAGHVDLIPGPAVARSYDGGMLTADRPKPPAPVCPPAQVGPCQGCQQPTHRYGNGGNPLCAVCLPPVRAAQGTKVR